ncbi:FABP family protein [Corynebacterium occultum]|uniref:FABP family protein n=1 Tax=Corynebacterium occultum TaxID=2675219 RepID=UPI0012E2A9C1|nr:FABP family protein [Corynebacterium occultum]
MDLHPNVQPYEFLLGTWTGEGKGIYPTISKFSYTETLSFAAIPGKPFLRYEQKTMGPQGPMHTEVGYLRPVAEDRLELVVAQPTGQTELLEGEVRSEGRLFVFEKSVVKSSATAKQVDATKRTYTFNPERTEMLTAFGMAAVGQPMQQHLESRLLKGS